MNVGLPPGKLRWVATLQAPPDTQNDYGEITGAWTDVETDLRLRIEPTSASNAETGIPQREVVNWYKVTTYYNTAISPKRRFLVSGVPYDEKYLFIADVQHELGKTIATCLERIEEDG